MPSSTVVATANVLSSLPRDQARGVLAAVLAEEPDLVALQEWWPNRAGLLRATGSVAMVPGLGVRVGSGGYRWSSPWISDCTIGARADRFDVVAVTPHVLDWPEHAERTDRPLGVEPPRFATQGVYRERATGREVVLLCHHLSPGVQSGGAYRTDRPRLVARHRREVRRLQRLADAQRARGRTVYVAGDANFHGFALDGWVSAWAGREDEPGTCEGRRIDDVLAAGPARAVRRVSSASDHDAVLAVHDDG